MGLENKIQNYRPQRTTRSEFMLNIKYLDELYEARIHKMTVMTPEISEMIRLNPELGNILYPVEQAAKKKHSFYRHLDQEFSLQANFDRIGGWHHCTTCPACLIPKLWCQYCETIHCTITDTLSNMRFLNNMCTICTTWTRLYNDCEHKYTYTWLTNRPTHALPTREEYTEMNTITVPTLIQHAKMHNQIRQSRIFEGKHHNELAEELKTKHPALEQILDVIETAKWHKDCAYITLDDLLMPQHSSKTGICIPCLIPKIWCYKCKTLHIPLKYIRTPPELHYTYTCQPCNVMMESYGNCREQKTVRKITLTRKVLGREPEQYKMYTADQKKGFDSIAPMIRTDGDRILRDYPTHKQIYRTMVDLYTGTTPRTSPLMFHETIDITDITKNTCILCTLPERECHRCGETHKTMEYLSGLPSRKSAELASCDMCARAAIELKKCLYGAYLTQANLNRVRMIGFQLTLPGPEMLTFPNIICIGNMKNNFSEWYNMSNQTERKLIKALPQKCKDLRCKHINAALEQHMTRDFKIKHVVGTAAQIHGELARSKCMEIAYFQHFKRELERDCVDTTRFIPKLPFH